MTEYNYLRQLADILSPPSSEDDGLMLYEENVGQGEIDTSVLKPSEGPQKLCPRVEFAYSQDLRVQDVFMPLNFRTPSSASCEWLRVTVYMPEENGPSKEIVADIVRGNLLVDSTKYHLNLNLPQQPTSDSNSHRATWDAETKKLIVHVKLERELDFVNF